MKAKLFADTSFFECATNFPSYHRSVSVMTRLRPGLTHSSANKLHHTCTSGCCASWHAGSWHSPQLLLEQGEWNWSTGLTRAMVTEHTLSAAQTVRQPLNEWLWWKQNTRWTSISRPDFLRITQLVQGRPGLPHSTAPPPSSAGADCPFLPPRREGELTHPLLYFPQPYLPGSQPSPRSNWGSFYLPSVQFTFFIDYIRNKARVLRM